MHICAGWLQNKGGITHGNKLLTPPAKPRQNNRDGRIAQEIAEHQNDREVPKAQFALDKCLGNKAHGADHKDGRKHLNDQGQFINRVRCIQRML